jgi:hypothetical protein
MLAEEGVGREARGEGSAEMRESRIAARAGAEAAPRTTAGRPPMPRLRAERLVRIVRGKEACSQS